MFMHEKENKKGKNKSETRFSTFENPAKYLYWLENHTTFYFQLRIVVVNMNNIVMALVWCTI